MDCGENYPLVPSYTMSGGSGGESRAEALELTEHAKKRLALATRANSVPKYLKAH